MTRTHYFISARSRLLAVGVGAFLAALTLGILPARADAGDEAHLLALTNSVRSSQGVGALSIDSRLNSVAQAWAVQLAQNGVLSHNASLPSQVTGWKTLGENVGVGGTVDAVHAGFVASPTHYENLVDPAFTKVGFGFVRPDARIFIVEVFMQPSAQSSTGASVVKPAATAPPATTPAAAPATAPAPRTTPAPAPVTAPATATTPTSTVGAATTAPAPSASELSPWMVHSLDRLRSMEEPIKAA